MEIRQGYKKTEVGVIPEDWEVTILNAVTKITRLAGYEYSSVWQETENGEIIALRGFNIGKNKIIDREFVRISDKLSMKLIRSRLYKGDVVYPCVGTIGNAVVIDEDNKYHIQQNIAKITPKKFSLDSNFLAHYLMSDFGLKEIEKFNGSSSQPNILVGSLRNYSIILPSLSEQTGIATALSDADALTSSIEQLIDKKRNIKQGAIQTLLQPKQGWELRNLGNLFTITAGGDLNTDTFSWIRDDNFPYPVYSNALTNNGLYGYSSGFKQIENTITVTARGQIGFANPRNHKYTAIGRVIILNPLVNDLNIIFLSECINNFIEFSNESTGVPQLTAPQISKYEIIIPKFEEQTRIATIVSDMDAEIAALEAKLEKYRMIKQGMMQYLLTGKIRLV